MLSDRPLRPIMLHLNDAMARWEVNTLARSAAFVAQQRYEPPADLAARLGNTEPGDGKRYKGRGPIQVTGRSDGRGARAADPRARGDPCPRAARDEQRQDFLS